MTTPTPPPARGKVRLFTRFEPAWAAGQHTLEAEQTADEKVGNTTLHQVTAADSFVFEVVAPELGLEADDVLAAYPPPESEEANDLMLPHVVLRRRTLPWERGGPGGEPWVALLLFSESESASITQQSETPPYQTLRVKRSLLHRVMPRRGELPYLCHGRELNSEDRVKQKDDDGFVSIVLGNRLPVAGSKNLCVLVSLKDRFTDDDVFIPSNFPSSSPDAWVDLVALYSWTFTAGKGGDFEEIIKKVPPARLGNGIGDEVGYLPLQHRDREGNVTPGLYRGPCVPLPLQRAPDIALSTADALGVTPGGEAVLSYASAFELGRLLAESSQEIRTALTKIRSDVQVHTSSTQAQVQYYKPMNDLTSSAPLPPGPSDGPGFIGGGLDDPMRWLDKGHLQGFTADPSAIRHLIERVPGLTLQTLQQFKPALQVEFSGPRGSAAKAALGTPAATPVEAAPPLQSLSDTDPSQPLAQQLDTAFAHVAARVLADIDTVG